MKQLTLTAALLFSLSLTAQHHRARIHYNAPADLEKLSQMGVATDHGHHKAGVWFESDFSEAELTAVRAAGLDYDVVIPNVEAFYVNQNKPDHPAYVGPASDKNATCGANAGAEEVEVPQGYNAGSMGGFLNYSEMLAELDEMFEYSESNGLNIMTRRADLNNPDDPGDFTTFEGNQLQWVKFSDDPATDDDAEPEVLYTAIHHAREPASLQQLIFYMWYLLENYANDPAVRSIVDNTELYFIPCVNPDGYLHNEAIAPNGGGLWRKNRRDGVGVDLNRNYNYVTPAGDSVWNTTGVSTQPFGQTWPGTSAFSEPETRAMRYFTEQHDFSIALNNHTFGQLLLYPYGYDVGQVTPDNNYFEVLSEAMVADNGYVNQLSAELYPASGDSDDFMYGYLATADGGTREKVLAMTPEVGPDFWPAQSRIEGIVKDMLTHNLRAAHSANVYAVAEVNMPVVISELETTIDFNLTRLGLRDGDITVSLEPVTPNVLATTETQLFSDLTLTETRTGSLELKFREDILEGETVQFNLVVDNGLFPDKYPVNLVYGSPTTVVTNDAESLAAWTATGDWGVTPNVFHPSSPSSSITDSPFETYQRNSISSVTLNESIDLTTSGLEYAQLSFYARWHIEADYDQVQVEVSNDDGATWIPQCGKYTRSGLPTHVSPDEPLYDGIQDEWVFEEIDLSNYLGQNIRIRFELSSDNGVQLDGFFFDNLQVNTIRRIPVGTVNVNDLPLTVSPNPMTDQLRVDTELSNWSYELTDVSGRVVTAADGAQSNTLINTADLPAGSYVLSVIADGKRQVFKVVK